MRKRIKLRYDFAFEKNRNNLCLKKLRLTEKFEMLVCKRIQFSTIAGDVAAATIDGFLMSSKYDLNSAVILAWRFMISYTS